MLTSQTRFQFNTLLDAISLQDVNDHPAITLVSSSDAPLHISRLEFANTVKRYSATLHEFGIREGDLIILAHDQILESIYAFWGAIWIGAIPSMFPTLTEKLDPAIYMRDMSTLVQSSDVRAVFTSDQFAPTLSANIACRVVNTSELHQSGLSRVEPNQASPAQIALLQHSSGTTGLQKGVALSHRAVLNQIASYADALSLCENDIFISWLPLYHDMGLIAGFLQPLIQGIPLILMSPFDWVQHPALLLKAIHEFRGTLCWLPNFAYNHCARAIRQRDSAGLDLSSMRAFINCSEPVRHSSHMLFAQRFAENGIRLEHFAVSYAMAENTFAVTQTAIGTYPRVDVINRYELQSNNRAIAETSPDQAEIIVSCGAPIQHSAVKIIDENKQVLSERHVGEIWVKSDCMLTEYYHRPDLAPLDSDGWYNTGDRGYLAEGEVFVIGRSKDLIINAGKNIYPQDIESIVNTVGLVHPGRAVIFGVPDEREGTELLAVIAEVDTDDPAERKLIAQQIRQRVAQQANVTISFIHLVNRGWLIKTSSGKIARSKNRDKWQRERA
jgi:acyl-CoA synthetase (AMP-forming)/AMP-acid ligase II